MLEIKKSPYKRMCDARQCKDMETYLVGQHGESPAFAKAYCKDHLIEIARLVNEMFGSNQNVGAVPAKPSVPEYDLNELINENKNLKSKMEEFKSTDVGLLKANLASAEASNNLFKENISTLESEIKRLKQANKGNKPGKSKSKK
jgi:ribosomal protein L1